MENVAFGTSRAMQKARANVELRKIDFDDLDKVAEIHIAAFPESAWTKLGKEVVKKYYKWQMDASHPLVLAKGVFLGERCVGFCFSGIFNGSTSGFLHKNKNLLVTRVCLKPWLVLSATFRQKLINGNRFSKNFKQKSLAQSKQTDSYGILAIAVSPKHQGLGIGKILLDDAEAAAIQNKFRKMDLSVNVDNTSAIKFYEKLGWEKKPKGDEWSGIMIKLLNTE